MWQIVTAYHLASYTLCVCRSSATILECGRPVSLLRPVRLAPIAMAAASSQRCWTMEPIWSLHMPSTEQYRTGHLVSFMRGNSLEHSNIFEQSAIRGLHMPPSTSLKDAVSGSVTFIPDFSSLWFLCEVCKPEQARPQHEMARTYVSWVAQRFQRFQSLFDSFQPCRSIAMSRGTGVQTSWGTSSQWCQWMKNASKASLSKEWFESQSGISMRFKNAESCCHSERIKLRRIWGIAPSPNRQPIPTRQEAWGNGELTRFCDAVKHKQQDSEREHIHHLCCSTLAFDSSVSVTFDWWCLSLPHSRFLRHLAVEIEMGWMCFSFFFNRFGHVRTPPAQNICPILTSLIVKWAAMLPLQSLHKLHSNHVDLRLGFDQSPDVFRLGLS